jgi:hypothetical protein
MTSDCDTTVPDDGPPVSIVDIACGALVRTRDTSAAAPGVVAVDLAARLRAHAPRPTRRRPT